MIVIDGKVYQARADGSVVEMPDSAATPFAAVVNFDADQTGERNGTTNIRRAPDNHRQTGAEQKPVHRRPLRRHLSFHKSPLRSETEKNPTRRWRRS